MDAQDFLGAVVESARVQMGGGSPSWASPRLVALELGWVEESLRRGLAHLGLCWTQVEQAARGGVSLEALVAGVPAGKRGAVEVRQRGQRVSAPAVVWRPEVVVEAQAPAPRPAPKAVSAQDGVFVALDVETTGSSAEDRVIELALVFFKDFEPVSAFVRRYSSQGRAIDPFAAKVHGITARELVGCPVIEEDLEKIHGWLTRAPAIVAHNLPYDRRMVSYELARAGLTWPTGPKQIDTLPLCKRANPTKKKGYTLSDVCFLYQVPLEKHHSAASDARAAGLVWRALYERGVRV